MSDIIKDIENLSRGSFDHINDYFSKKIPNEDNGKAVDRALKLIGAYSRVRATRANEAAISVAIAKMNGVSGEALLPVFKQLTGINPMGHLQKPEDDKD